MALGCDLLAAEGPLLKEKQRKGEKKPNKKNPNNSIRLLLVNFLLH